MRPGNIVLLQLFILVFFFHIDVHVPCGKKLFHVTDTIFLFDKPASDNEYYMYSRTPEKLGFLSLGFYAWTWILSIEEQKNVKIFVDSA